MKRRIVYSRLPQNLYDTLDEAFEDVPLGRTSNPKIETDIDNGCFSGFFRFFRFFVKK